MALFYDHGVFTALSEMNVRKKKKKTGVGGLLMLFAEPKLHEWFDKIKRTMPTVCMTTDNPHGQQVPGLTWQVTAPCISCHHRGTESSWVQWSLHRPHQHTNSPTQVSATSARFVCRVVKSSELHLHSCCDDSQRATTPSPLID